jgi:adenosine deaminase
LHAHLSGSVRDTTIIELLNEESRLKSTQINRKELDLIEELRKYPTGPRDLHTCFEIFSILHRVLKKREILERVTREILDDFREQNCVYLELRTTPRDIYNEDNQSEIVVSKRDYLNSVIKVIEEFERDHPDVMIVRLLISIDRSKGLKEGLENVELAKEYNRSHSSLVVGIDFSGNPQVSTFRELKPIFDLVRQYNLKMTVHIAEHWEDSDLEFILKEIRPERIGHAVCLSKEWIDYLIEKQSIPIEICPTSNLITKIVDMIENHPFYEFYKVKQDYPLVICTDDFGVFRTSLTNEYFLIANAFKLSQNEMFLISKQSIQFIFDRSESTFHRLNKKFDSFFC